MKRQNNLILPCADEEKTLHRHKWHIDKNKIKNILKKKRQILRKGGKDMANNFKRRSLKGVVLIMVVTVMLMLIILLLATMAVVSTAQNRYYTKFEENQAYYTARSALDVYVSNIFSDESYLAYDGATVKQYSYTDGAGAVQTTDMKQGLAMQLDTYRIKAHSDTMENYNLMADKTQFSTDHWANSTNDIFSGTPEKAYYEVPDLDYIDYQIEFPRVENGTNSYGGIVDTDSSNKQIAKIRVEVLARTYNGHSAAYPASPSAADVTADKTAINNGERYKDAVYLKATSIVEFQGVEGTASVVFSAPEMENQFTSALTATGSIPATNHGLIIDGYSTPYPADFRDELILVGKAYNGGLLSDTGNGNSFQLSAGECAYIKGISIGNVIKPISLSNVTDEKDVPLFFVDGNYDVSSTTAFNWCNGASAGITDRIDLLVSGDLTIKGDTSFNGNIYVGGNLILLCNNGLNLSSGCNIIVGGDIEIQNSNILPHVGSAPIYCGGDLIIPSWCSTTNFPTGTGLHMKPGAEFAIGTKTGTYHLVDVGGQCHIQDALLHDYGTVSKLAFDADAFDYIDVTAVPTDAGSQIYLPKINGSNVEATNGDSDYLRYVPAEYSMYSKYWRRNNTAPYAYQLDGMGNHIFIGAEEMAGSTKAEREVGDYSNALDFSTPPAGATNFPHSGSVTSPGDYVLNTGSYDTRIDCLGEVNIYVNGSSFSGAGITVDNKAKVNFYFPGNASYTMEMPIWNDEVKAGYQVSPKELRFGSKDKDPNALSAPKIKYFIEANAQVNFYNNRSVWAGYVYGPEADVVANTGGLSFGGTYYYNGDSVVGVTNEKAVVIGSLVCRDVSIPNESAFCYIKDEDNPQHGDPFWDSGDPFYYTRN